MTDEELARWLHSVSLGPGADRQSAIGQAAKALAASSRVADVTGYVLLAYGLADEVAFTKLRDAISTVDSTFGCSIDDLETRLAAAVCVAETMERTAIGASIAAHSVMSAEWLGLKSAVPDLVIRAKESLHDRAGAVRNRSAITVAADIEAATSGLPELPEDSNPLVHLEARLIQTALVGGLEAVKKAVDGLSARVATRLQATDEELDLLWWAFSGYSERLDQRWTATAHDGLVAVMMAFEMAQLIKFSDEPQSTTELLAHLLGARAEHEVALGPSVAAAYRDGRVPEVPAGHTLLPVLTCLTECRALGGKSAWKGSVRRWSIDVSIRRTALDLAQQCVRELLLIRQFA